MPTATYKIKDVNGRELASLASVLAPVELTALSTTSASNIITVASTTGLYPGMPVAIPNVPVGAFIHTVRNATTFEVWLSTFNLTTGVWSTSAANANATANGSSLVGHAFGYHPNCIIASVYAMGTWRNLHDTTSHGFPPTTSITTMTEGSAKYYQQGFGKGLAVFPTAGTVASGIYTPTAFELLKSDVHATTPLKRHNGEIWGVRPFVHTSGFVSHVSANPEHHIALSAIA